MQRNITQPLKKNEMLSFATTWMNLEDIMPGEISQRKANTVYYYRAILITTQGFAILTFVQM